MISGIPGLTAVIFSSPAAVTCGDSCSPLRLPLTWTHAVSKALSDNLGQVPSFIAYLLSQPYEVIFVNPKINLLYVKFLIN